MIDDDDGLEKSGCFIDNHSCSLAGTKRKYGGAPAVPRNFRRRMKQGFLKDRRNKKSLDFSRLLIGAESGT
ncbi:MAG: hypothetical protein IKR09_03260 [Alphaproteobacteria bacterium]|nr:hypothetical protein [Alphaproteobacteria bacterium]